MKHLAKKPRLRRFTDRSAGGVVTTRIAERPKLLLIKDSYAKWAIPKGHLDSGETSEQAAVRETEEETGLATRIAGKLGVNRYKFRSGNKLIDKTVDVYLLEVVGDPTVHPEKLDPHEGLVHDARWFTPEAAVKKVSYPNLRPLILKAAEKVGTAHV